jgi:uncharacterized protein YndB with AHSA1/START domain
MKVQKTVVVDKPLEAVFDYLSDFTTTTQWDPGTVSTSYHNTSEFMGRRTELNYVVQELIPGQRISLRGENKTVISVDTMSFRRIEAGTEVTYAAEFTFKGAARFVAPLFKPALDKLGQQAETGLRDALSQL